MVSEILKRRYFLVACKLFTCMLDGRIGGGLVTTIDKGKNKSLLAGQKSITNDSFKP